MAKTAAEQAKDAAEQVKKRMSNLDTVGELSSAITIMQEIMRLQRTQAWPVVWDIVLDRYAILQSHLVRSEQGLGLTEAHRSSVRTAIAQFRVIVEDIARARTEEHKEQLDTARLNKMVSHQIESIERAKIRAKNAGA